jgi:hypothetical protein
MADIDLKVGSLQLGAKIDPKKLKNMFMSLEKKMDLETTAKLIDIYENNKTSFGVASGIASLLTGEDVDPRPFVIPGKEGDHTFGIRDLNMNFMEDYPELFYSYGGQDSPFNIEAKAGGNEENKYMGVEGKYTFSQGGLSTLMAY